MAAVALATVVRSLGELLGKQLFEEASLLYGVKDEVEWIERELRRMQSFLKDAEAKAKDDERIKNWIREVREVACMAEDVVDTFNLEIEDRGTGRKGCDLRNFISILKKLKTRHKVGKKIQEIRLKIHEISESRSTYGIGNIDTEGQGKNYERQSLKEWRRSSPHLEEPDFVGFKEDRELLEARLLQREERRCVVSITGMGGIGKTTLAKKLYNRVRNNFTCLAWIYISQEYVVEELLQYIGKRVGLPELKLKEMNKEELEEELYKFLMRRKYLIVLDDIWKTRTWDELQEALPDGVSGSKIIITTRNRDVAIHADARTPAHELPFLDEDESWELFSRKVFPNKEIIDSSSYCPPELEGLGREIVAKCGGLPLALVVMGGLLLRKQKTVQAWKTVMQSMNWQLAQDDNLCMKILALSFNDLPDYLKSCFLYFGIFPEDHEIYTSKLINLWVAEGFIKRRGREAFEDAADDCLDELTQRSLIQSVIRRFDGRIKSCRIHDLLRDLSISKAMEGNFLYVCNEKVAGPAFPSRVRRLAFHGEFSLNHNNERIHTLISFQNVHEVDWHSLCGAFKFLVILDLPGLGSKLPYEIGELVKLKYLGLRGAINQSLPSTLCDLPNLQTLDGSESMLEVPATIWKMRQLRHLYVGVDSEIHLPKQANDVSTSALQTLSQLNTDTLWLNGWKHLRNLKNLRKLKLYGNYMEKEELAELPECLESLWLDKGCQTFQGLVFSSYLHLHKLSLKGRLEKLPDIHEFPPHLAKLTLGYSRLEQDPMPLLERLPYLRCLTLLDDSYVGDKMVCSMGGFQRLEDLQLIGLRQMLLWEITGGMLRLERLTIHSCSKLNKVPNGLKGITTLKVLDINMPSSFNSRLNMHKIDWDKIKHIPSIITTINKSDPRLERIPTGVPQRRQEDLPWYQREHDHKRKDRKQDPL
ncbi:toMV resistance protein Tm-2(2)-like [Telopea speciosissima]|uniref:toMV resistance protein Tm-2(2)-like n=1 Tax=Telopea speciosissima TaxID=54955 RepID=UPI001CC3990A|nr:toMV resistance protein Tm-2(2)-like [Telopea speciosissima]